MSMLDIAKNYLKLGMSVIPGIPGRKNYYVPWEDYQKRLPNETEINNWWSKYPNANIGIVTGIISGLAVIDVDDESEKEQIEKYIPDNLVFPIATTPRGGQHWYFKCLDSTIKSVAPIPGFKKVDVRANGGVIIAPPSVGANGKIYKWQDNLSIESIEIPLIPDSLYRILPKNVPQQAVESTGDMFIHGRRDEDLFHIAFALTKAKLPVSEIYQTLMRLAQACEPPFPLKEAEAKVMSALKRASEQPRDIKLEVQHWCLSQDGAFRVDSCFNELSLKQKEHKAECREVIADLIKRGIIEKGKAIGVYRLMNQQVEHIEIPDHRPEAIPFKWPFGIENFVDLYKGNVAIIAGVSNAGKSALLLNCAYKNMDNFRIRYQSSEMEGDELYLRLKGLGVGLDVFRQKVEWIKRSTDWWDLILPDDVNMIDFMEIHEEFYKIGDWIKKVFDKLRGGIAIIAIQKKDSKTDVGRGGAITKEKARLYISVDYGSLCIVKAKNWHDFEVDPNGMKIDFTLKKGIILENVGPWRFNEKRSL